MPHQPVNPPAIRPPFASYSHAILVEPGARMLFASGQLGVSPDDAIPEDIEAQAELCFANIRAILAQAGMDFHDVVRFNAFVTDRAYFPVYGRVPPQPMPPGGTYSDTVVVTITY